jgi:pilus assembly protein CpaC
MSLKTFKSASWSRPLLAVLAISTAGLGASDAAAQPAPTPIERGGAMELVVPAGKSQVLEIPGAYSDLMIANPEIADVLPLTSRSVYVVGKKPGATALTVYGPGKRLIAAANIVVSADIEGLKARLSELLPGERDIVVRPANESIVLSGSVSAGPVAQRALALAETYAPGKVVNMLAVEGVQQVMLSVRFVEMERSASKGIRSNISGRYFTGSGDNQILFQSGDTFASTAGALADSFGGLAGAFTGADGNLDLLIDALESKGVVRTLAEPNLVAMSGDTASFLAGGEFPVPVAQESDEDGSTITIEFKQFGIALGFTPTVLKDGLINLVVNPEVSSIDPNTTVRSAGFEIPGIKVRRARTTIELRDGESFTIAGLMADEYTNTIRQYPLLGDVPVLGALFKSTAYQRKETELVIVVTPHLVTPRRGLVATPADRFAPPSDFELFLLGAQGAAGKPLNPEDRALLGGGAGKGGVEGPFGHVLY